MTYIKQLAKRIRGWLPKDYGFTLAKMQKPRWWKPFWVAIILANLAWIIIVFYFIFRYPVERIVLLTFLAFFCIGIAYYMRVHPSMKVNRALYILLGVTPIGLCIWIVTGLLGLSRLLINIVGPLPSLIITWTVCLGIGAFIGDWIGKKRNYKVPLTP